MVADEFIKMHTLIASRVCIAYFCLLIIITIAITKASAMVVVTTNAHKKSRTKLI